MKTKKIVITGASSGIGKQFGEYFQSINWEIVNISRSKSKFKNYQLDLSKIEFADTFLDIIDSEKPDIVIFNSGILLTKWMGQYTADEIIKSSMLNSIMPIILLNKLINKNIKLVFISSIASRITSTVQAVYGANKSYLTSAIQAAQAEQLYLHGKSNVIEVVPAKLPATNIDQKSIPISKKDNDFLKNEVKIISNKIIEGQLTIWSHNNFYKAIAKRFFEEPLTEGQKSIKYKIKKGVITNNIDK